MFWVSLVYRVWRAGDSLEKPDMSVESAESVHQDGLIWQLTSSRTSLGRLETEQVLTVEGGECHHHRLCCRHKFIYFFCFFLPTFGLADFNQPEGFASTCSSGGFTLYKLELLFLNTSYGLFTRGICERKNEQKVGIFKGCWKCSIQCISVGQKSNNSNA